MEINRSTIKIFLIKNKRILILIINDEINYFLQCLIL
jgi:hypothetical protein